MPYISIIITIYNRAGDILTALKSIPKRDDIEVIVVNDGSTDNLLEVIKATPIKIKLLNQLVNKGVGYCRNLGLSYATGNWIVWLDSDDYFLPEINDLFNQLYKLEKDYNAVKIKYTNNKKVTTHTNTAPWGRIYKKEIYDLVDFPNIRNAEDWYWAIKLNKLYSNKIKMIVMDKPYYHYNYPNNGLWTQANVIKKDKVKNKEAFEKIENPQIVNEYETYPTVDLVVTYLNSSDKNWQEQYNYWAQYEIENKLQDKNNKQAFGEERIRNWGDAFKYWFRGVAQNLPWVRYVHLIVFDEAHIPEWLDVNCPKLKIHYHRDFIPKEYLPTFNAINISNFICMLPDLSENYIHCDDDYYFFNYVDKSNFFYGVKPILDGDYYKSPYVDGNKEWEKIINSNVNFYMEHFDGEDKIYKMPHLPSVRNKFVEQEMIKMFEEFIPKSKFRTLDNLIIVYISYIYNHRNSEIGDVWHNSQYVNLNFNTNFDGLKNKDMVCLNDTGDLKDYEQTNNKLNKFLYDLFPNKSIFEK